MFNVVKNKSKSTNVIVFYILFFMLIACIVSIKIFRVQVCNSEEIKDSLIGEKVNVNGEDLELTRENLLDVKIISRETEKNEKDKVKVRLKIDTSKSIEDINGIVDFIYRDGNWNYDKAYTEDVFNMNLESKNSEDVNVIEKLILEEIKSDGVCKFKKLSKYKEVYLKADEKSIESLKIDNYKIREDYSIRAEISGKIYLENYKESFLFTGFVSISRKLKDGRRKNAKDIIIYDVPLNKE